MDVNNANNVSANDNDGLMETQGSLLLLRHDLQIGTKTKQPYEYIHHPQKTFEMMNDMRIQNLLCDVTLVADSLEIPAHKMVLASCSPYFYTMFNSCFEESKQDRITLKEVDHQALVLLIEYAYTSEVTITEENVEALLSVANLLRFMDVRDACCEFLQAQLHPTNCLGIRAFADIHGCFDLLANSEYFIKDRFPQVVECGEFLSLAHQQVTKWISSDILQISSEKEVFECVIAWVHHDLENRRKHLASLMEHVRLPLLSKDYLVHRFEEEPLFRVDPQCHYYLEEAMTYHLLEGDDKRNFTSPRTKPRKPLRPAQVLLVVGGDRMDLNTVECFDFEEERWYRVADMTRARIGPGVAVLNGKVHAVGGFSQEDFGTVDVYDPGLNKWAPSCATLNVLRIWVGVTVLNDLIYAVGGFDRGHLNTAEVFDTKTQSWKMISPMSTERSYPGVAVLNNLLYAVGGCNLRSPLRSVECYNPKTDTWSPVPDMLVRRWEPGVAVLNGKLYAVGGYDGSSPLKSVEAYDPKKKTWTLVAEMASSRLSPGVAAVNRLLYVVGGHDGRYTPLSSVEVYDPEEDTWTMLPSMAIARQHPGVAIIDKSLMEATLAADDRDVSAS